jgi:hypothetical protein
MRIEPDGRYLLASCGAADLVPGRLGAAARAVMMAGPARACNGRGAAPPRRDAAGKLADQILADGDPTVEISHSRRVVTVVKDGRVCDPAAIYDALGVRPCCGLD